MPRPSCANAFISRRRGFTSSYPDRGGSMGTRTSFFEPPFIVQVNVMLLQSIADISALVITSFTLPNHFAYATRVSGWLDMYMRRNEDFSATGSLDIVGTIFQKAKNFSSFFKKKSSLKFLCSFKIPLLVSEQESMKRWDQIRFQL